MKKLSFDLDDYLMDNLIKEAKQNERAVSAQLRIILKARYNDSN